MNAAIPELDLQQEALETFSREQGEEQVEEWKTMIRAWELSPDAPNPYELPKSGKLV